jgi:hypothetical protein
MRTTGCEMKEKKKRLIWYGNQMSKAKFSVG